MTPTREERLRHWTGLLACNFIWGSQFVMLKLVQQHVGSLSTVMLPVTLSMLLLVPIVRAERRRAGPRPPIPRSDWAGFIALGVFGQAAAQLGATLGVERTTASNAALLTLTLPVVTAAVAFAVLGEKMSRWGWLGLALSLAGVWWSAGIDPGELSFGAGSPLAGNLFVMLGVAGSAFYNVFSKKLLTRYSQFELLLWSYVAFVVPFLPAALAAEGVSALGRLPLTAWLGLAALALFQYFLSMVIFLRVLARLSATQAAVSNYLIPVFGVVVAALVLGERLTAPMLLGGVLVLGGTLVATVVEGRKA